MEGNLMKTAFAATVLLGLLVLGTRDAQAQAYGPYYYGPYWDGSQYQQYVQRNPYYDLEVMHYQLYLPQHQPYPIYQPCCFLGGVIIPWWSTPISPLPPAIVLQRLQ